MDWMVNWWTWAIFALALVILEIMAPALCAAWVWHWRGGDCAAAADWRACAVWWIPALGVCGEWAVLSLIAWIALQQVFKMPRGKSKTFDHDIND